MRLSSFALLCALCLTGCDRTSSKGPATNGGDPAGDRGVMSLRYAKGSESTEQRENGFLDTMRHKEFPEIRIISEEGYAGATRQTSLDASQRLLDKYGPRLDGIFACNESIANGMLKALEQAGLDGKVVFVGFDTSTPMITATWSAPTRRSSNCSTTPGSARYPTKRPGAIPGSDPLETSIIDPRPARARPGPPPDDAALRPAGVSAHDRRQGARDPPDRHRAAGRHEGQDPDRRGRRLRLPGPVTVICKVLGVPVEAVPRFHDWIETALDGVDLSPEAASRRRTGAWRR